MSSPIIEFKNVSFSYGKTPTLNQVNLSVYKGEMIGIIGPNGGGKTTLLKLILALLNPTSGELSAFGKNPKLMTSCFGYVPQVTRFDAQFPITVLELVLMGLLSQMSKWGTYSSKEKKLAIATLAEVGLEGLEMEAFGNLSGGQAQRALIARALVGNPEIILLDEPTASIDPLAEKEIFKIILALKRKKTICLVTHDLQTVCEDVDRVFYVAREVSEVTPSQLCAHYPLGLYHFPLSFTKQVKDE